MNRFSKIAISLVCLLGFALSGLAQSSTITTYAGIGHWPVSGTQAVTQPIGSPVSVIPDAFGRFYFAGSDQPRIYPVTADRNRLQPCLTRGKGFSCPCATSFRYLQPSG